MFEFIHDFDLVADMVDQTLGVECFLFYLFDGVDGACFFMSALPDKPIRTLSKVSQILKISLIRLGLPSSLHGGREIHDTVGQLIQLHFQIIKITWKPILIQRSQNYEIKSNPII